MSKGFTLLEIIVVALILIIFVGFLIPALVVYKNETLHESEAMSNLNRIQLAIERFAVDTEGTYPQYLIGGSSRDPSFGDPSSGIFGKGLREDYLSRLSDPLVRRGYIHSYPRNPFAGNGKKILKHQEKVGGVVAETRENPVRSMPENPREMPRSMRATIRFRRLNFTQRARAGRRI